MKQILILFLLTLSLGTVNATENTVKPFTESYVKIGYKLDEFDPSKQEKKVKKKDNVGEDKSDGLSEEEKRKIRNAFKHTGLSLFAASIFFMSCFTVCVIAMVIYMTITCCIVKLQHKYAKRHYKDK